jgi:hypothetical protein
MSRHRVSRLVLAVIFVTLLALAGPARAEAADLASPRPVWDWLASLWEDGISTLWTRGESAGDKAGPGFDPNGLPLQGSSASSPAPTAGITIEGDAGPGFDPNG